MNKSILFLFGIFSTINFSCLAMEHVRNLAEYYTQETIPNAISLINHVYKNETTQKKQANNYIKALNAYNTHTDLLIEAIKKNENSELIRWNIIDDLNILKKDISFLVNAINHQHNTHNDESLRLFFFDNTIEKLNKDTLCEVSTIEKNQEIINKLAIFSGNGDSVNFERSTAFWQENIINSCYEVLEKDYPDVLELYESKIETKQHINNQKTADNHAEQKKQAELDQKQKEHDKQTRESLVAQVKELAQELQQIIQEKTKAEQERLAKENADLDALKNKRLETAKNKEQEVKLTQKITELNKQLEDAIQFNVTQGNLTNLDQQKLERQISALKVEKTGLALERDDLLTQNQEARRAHLDLEGKLRLIYLKIKVCAGLGVTGIAAALLVYYFELHSKLLSIIKPI